MRLQVSIRRLRFPRDSILEILFYSIEKPVKSELSHSIVLAPGTSSSPNVSSESTLPLGRLVQRTTASAPHQGPGPHNRGDLARATHRRALRDAGATRLPAPPTHMAVRRMVFTPGRARICDPVLPRTSPSHST